MLPADVPLLAEIFRESVLDLTGDGRSDYQTLAGFVLARLGRLPQAGDHVVWQGHRFEVVDMDGNRVDKVLVAPLPARRAAEAD